MGLGTWLKRRFTRGPSAEDLGEATPRGPIISGGTGIAVRFLDIAYRTAEQWFGPHTPSYVPLFILDRMTLDETIALTMGARKALICSADYTVRCRSDVVRQFAQDQLERHLWRLLWTGMSALDFGFVVDELVWGIRPERVETVAPTGPQTTDLPAAWVYDAVRDQDPVQTDLLADEIGDYAGARIRRLSPLGLSGVTAAGADIPAHRSILFTHRMRFGRLHGQSGMLPAYHPWWWGNVLRQNMASYFAHKAVPPYKGKAPDPREWTAINGGGTDRTYVDPIEYMNTVLANLRSGGSIVMPSRTREARDGSSTGEPLFDVEVLNVPERKDEFVGALNYMDLLKVRGCMGNDLVVLIGSPGQAGAKSGSRLFYSILEPDQREWAEQCNAQFVRPLVRANFGTDAPETSIDCGRVAENKAELFVEIAKQLFGATQRLRDGRQYLTQEIVDVRSMLEEVGIPTHDVDQVARPGGTPPNPPPTSGTSPPPGRPRSDDGETTRHDSQEAGADARQG